MKCLRCHFETPGEAHMCGRCGAELPAQGAPLDAGATRTLTYSVGTLTDGVLFAGRYLVIDELGKGGMGCVYRVHDTTVDEEVALKFINPEIAADTKAVERFRSELRITRKITHQNVCRMYDLGEEGRSLYITMEYIPGEDLAHMIARLGTIPVEKAFLIARQVCEGLAEVHRLGVIHRDLKPKNIMIDREGHAKIMDFGLARTPHGIRLTEVGHIVGTPSFMSPEQLNGETLDPRTDIFALGVTLYNMLTGTLPFKADSTMALALEHRSRRPPGPHTLNPHIPEDLSRIVLKCLEIDESARYGSAGDLLTDLRRAGERFETYDFSVPRAPIFKTVETLLGRPWAKFAAGAAVLLVLAASGLAIRALLKKPGDARPAVSSAVLVDAPAVAKEIPPIVEAVPVAFVTKPDRATIEVDGVNKGLSDVTFDLTPGTHAVRIAKSGYQEMTATLVVEAGGTARLTREFKLVPLPPATGTLAVTSEPQDATAYLGDSGEAAGRTPFTKTVPSGKVRVRYVKEGYKERTEEVYVRPGNKSVAHGALMLLDGIVRISSDPPGAEVYNGNEFLGTTPFSRPLAPSVYRLRISLKGVGEKEGVIIVGPGETLAPPAYTFATPAPASLRYYLKITTNPPGASVTINGAPQKEVTPFFWELDTHEVHLRIGKEGYKNLEEVFYIRPLPARNTKEYELKRSDGAETDRSTAAK